MTKFTIPTRYPSLNEFITSNRANRYKGADMKKKCQQEAYIAIKQAKLQRVTKYPIRLKITWYEPNKRRDIDNITYASKFINDALVQAKVLEDDSQKYVADINNKVRIDKENPRIEVEIKEA